MVEILIYLLVGALAGTSAGLLGLGGGVVIVPALYMVFTAQGMPAELVMHMAVGTSLATIIFTSISSIYTHHQHNAVQWPLVQRLVPGIILGVLAGSVLADNLDSSWLRMIFGLFEIFVAAQMLFTLIPNVAAGRKIGDGIMLGAGGVTGSISALIGIGGGSVMVPFLSWCGLNMRLAVATSAACGFPIALFGSGSFMLLGADNNDAISNALGYIYLPALLGILVTSMLFARLSAKLAHRLPVLLLKRVFAIVLLLIGIKMVVG